jgi:HK97 family phage prohead protease
MSNNRRFVVGAELRASKSEKGLTIVARAVKYGALSLPNVPAPGCVERIAPGCFAKSLANNDEVVALVNHDPSQILGRTRNGSLQLLDDENSLRFAVRLNPNVQAHRDVHALVSDGTLSECSFAFSDVQDEWSDGSDDRGNRCKVRTIRSAKIHDVSIVTNAAYSGGATDAQARCLAYRFSTIVRPEHLREGIHPSNAALRDQLTDIDNRYRAALLGIEIGGSK